LRGRIEQNYYKPQLREPVFGFRLELMKHPRHQTCRCAVGHDIIIIIIPLVTNFSPWYFSSATVVIPTALAYVSDCSTFRVTREVPSIAALFN
jgi:hypothetical protein